MKYEKILLEVKTKYFPELEKINIKLKSFKNPEKHSLMRSSPINNTIYYNQIYIKKFSKKALNAAFAHELSHQVQAKNKGFLLTILSLIRIYFLNDKKFEKEIETEADKITIQKGLKNEFQELCKETEKIYPSEMYSQWLEKHSLKDFNSTS